jgi:hypothetical protein
MMVLMMILHADIGGAWLSLACVITFYHSQGGRLYMVRMTGQVLCELLRSPNRFIPSVLSTNLTFLASLPNLGNLALKRLHY